MITLAIGPALALLAGAPTGPSGKDQYTIFNPTPRELRRELSADRPDVTESPISVDAGAIQIEMSFVEWSRNGSEETLAIPPTNFKLGLTNSIDLQLAWDGWLRRHDDSGTETGAGDLFTRLKLNLWGNDPQPGQKTALALMPFVKFPTANDELGNGEVEGGLIVPLSIDLAEGLALALMAEGDVVYDEDDDDYDVEFLHTASLGVDLTKELGAFVEYIGIVGPQDYQGSLGIGVTFAITDDLMLDAGVNVGLLGDPDDLRLFTGMTIRF